MKLLSLLLASLLAASAFSCSGSEDDTASAAGGSGGADVDASDPDTASVEASTEASTEAAIEASDTAEPLDTSMPDTAIDSPEDTAAQDVPLDTEPKLVATIETSKGTIRVELNPDKAPITVDNFRKYADAMYYDGLIFHRVMLDFMIQGGGFEPGLSKRTALYPSIVNEAVASGLLNVEGAIAMARTAEPDSATAQFYINTVNNPGLDPGAQDPAGYAVFGQVIEGMDVVHEIEAVETQSVGMYDDVPVEDVLINSIRVAEE